MYHVSIIFVCVRLPGSRQLLLFVLGTAPRQKLSALKCSGHDIGSCRPIYKHGEIYHLVCIQD